MEFYNKNSQRKHPFTDDSDMSAIINGSEYHIPNSVFIDIRLSFRSSLFKGDVKLVSLKFIGVTLQLKFTIGDVEKVITIDSAAPDSGKYWVTRGSDSDISWLVVLGTAVSDLMSESMSDDVEFVNPPTIIPALVKYMCGTRVSSISDIDGSKVSGNVVLEEGYNCSITVSKSSIIINAESGSGAGYPCDTAETIGCSDVLFRLNGENAENVRIVGGPGVSIMARPEQHTIDILANPGNEC